MGNTTSLDFPVVNALQPLYGGGIADVFVTKINPSGSALLYSTYLGDSGTDFGYGIAVGSNGNAYVTGSHPRNRESWALPAQFPDRQSFAGEQPGWGSVCDGDRNHRW